MKTHHHTSYRGLGRRRGAAAVVLLLLLAGCSPSVSSLIHDPAYSYEEFRYAAGNKSLHTSVYGNPFKVPEEDVTQAVLFAMSRLNSSRDTALAPKTRFTTGPGARPEYHVEVVLNPTAETTTPCTEPQAVAAPQDDVIRARMVFCRGAYLLSTSVGAIDRVDQPEDPMFQRMIALMTRELFPERGLRRGTLFD